MEEGRPQVFPDLSNKLQVYLPCIIAEDMKQIFKQKFSVYVNTHTRILTPQCQLKLNQLSQHTEISRQL